MSVKAGQLFVFSLLAQTTMLTVAGERWACNVFYWCSRSQTALHGTEPSPGLLGGEWQPQLLSIIKTILWVASFLWGCLLWVLESAAVMEDKVLGFFFAPYLKLPCAFHIHKQMRVVARAAQCTLNQELLPCQLKNSAIIPHSQICALYVARGIESNWMIRLMQKEFTNY